jgi:hypothetical protein
MGSLCETFPYRPLGHLVKHAARFQSFSVALLPDSDVDSFFPSGIGPYHPLSGVHVWMIHGPFSFGVAAPLPSQVWWSLVNLFGKGSALGYYLTPRAATAMVSVAAVA